MIVSIPKRDYEELRDELSHIVEHENADIQRFQSLKGIMRNCERIGQGLLELVVTVSIPKRDYEELRATMEFP